jgi:hypothetical protein
LIDSCQQVRAAQEALRVDRCGHDQGGHYPDLLDEAYGWGSGDMWKYAFYALVAYVRAASERTGRSLEEIAVALAERQGTTLATRQPYPPATKATTT